MNIRRASGLQIGAIAWILSLQYYAVQIIAAAAWPAGYSFSWSTNTISDLGNTICGPYGSRLVCSPHHALMNASFVVLGVTMIIGGYLLRTRMQAKGWAHLGFGCMELAGLGTIFVGLWPENSVSTMHILGAGMTFVLGNLGMILLALTLQNIPRWLRGFSLLSGITGLLGTVFFVKHIYLGIGGGTIERFAAYPQSIWMIVFGTCILGRLYLKHAE